MIVGHGLVAQAFSRYKDSEEILIFASGVSQSKTLDQKQFKREKDLLTSTIAHNPRMTIVYFSTCSVYDPEERGSAYVKHKLEMEKVVAQHSSNYHIFRLSNLVGKTNNPFTIMNYLSNSITTNQYFQVWKNAERNIIDIDDVVYFVNYFVDTGTCKNEIVNIANIFNYTVPEIVEELRQVHQATSKCEFIDKGTSFCINLEILNQFFPDLESIFNKNYLRQVTQKYYGKQ